MKKKSPSGHSLWTPDRIQELRRRLGNITQERLAQVLGVTVATVNRWENGRKTVSNLSAMRLHDLWAETRETG